METPAIHTGPNTVGLETQVRPARAGVTRRVAGRSVHVTAPQCCYGRATYLVRVWSPGHRTRRLQYVEISSRIRSGGTIAHLIPGDWDDVEVLLDLVNVYLTPNVLSTFTADALIDALSHPLEVVREAAMCAVHRVRSE